MIYYLQIIFKKQTNKYYDFSKKKY